MTDFSRISEEEWRVLEIIAHTGGDDYDVWPWIEDNELPALNALEDRNIIGIMGNGDIRIYDDAIHTEAERRWLANTRSSSSDGLYPCEKCGNDTTGRLCRSCAEQEAIDRT